MQSWQSMYEMAQDLASDSDSDNLDLLKRLTNIGYHKVEKKLGIYFTEKIRTLTTVTDAISGTSNQSYRLFPDFASLTYLYVTVGSTQYWATLIQDDELWRKMNSTTTSSTSNFLSHCFIRADRVELFPIPSSASTGTMIYRSVSKDLSADDYTTGTITTLANGGTAITPEEKYLGSAISAGTSAYTIGEMPNLPDDETQMLPVYFALWKYFLFRKNRSMANMYKTEYKDGLKESVADWSNRSSSGVLKDQFNLHRHGVINPNEYPESMA